MRNPFITLLIASLLPVLSWGQTTFGLKITVIDRDTSFFASQKIIPQTTFRDTFLLKKEIQNVLKKLYDRSFLTASVPNLTQQDSTFSAQFYIGNTYRWARISSDISPFFLGKIGYRSSLWNNQLFDYQQLIKFKESLLTFAENNGFPFASVWLDSISVTDASQISARLRFEKYKFIQMDSLDLAGDAVVSENFLANYLGIQRGSAYNKSKIQKIRARLKELPFVEEKQDAVVTFSQEKATIHLFLGKKNASRFDFLLGLLPNPSAALTGGSRYLITGTASADMYNLLNRGERFSFDFQQLRPQTQQLKVQAAYPYLFRLPLGVEAKFDLYKRDTTNLDVSLDAGIQYLQEGIGNYFKLFYNQNTSSLLSINKQKISSEKQLPAVLDVRVAAFGLEWGQQRLDYRFNPRRGWLGMLRIGAGERKIQQNNLILNLKDDSQPNFNFASLYDSTTQKTIQYKIQGQAEFYLPLFRRAALKLAARAGGIFSEKPIYRNEQFRLGGNRLLRGFDEEVFFATLFSVFTVEYRLLLGKNSNFYLFSDYGYLEDKTTTTQRIDHPWSFGAGINFETTAGIFSLSYAFGRTDRENFDLRAGKIHFGYVTLF